MKIKKMKKDQLLIMGLLGIFLLVVMIPVPQNEEEKELYKEESSSAENINIDQSVEIQLKNALEKISGVGKVEVLITYRDNGTLVLEKDASVSEELIQEADSSGGTRTTTTKNQEQETVYDKNEAPYVIQELTPNVEGVLVVAQGAGNESVKIKIQKAIEALFGLEAHKISIMKMEVSK